MAPSFVVSLGGDSEGSDLIGRVWTITTQYPQLTNDKQALSRGNSGLFSRVAPTPQRGEIGHSYLFINPVSPPIGISNFGGPV